MAEPRKVQFVTLSTFAAGLATDSRKRRLDDAADVNFDGDGEAEATAATGADGGGGGRLGKTGNRDATEAKKMTVRLNLCLSEPDDHSSVEFNYGELIKNLQVRLVCVCTASRCACASLFDPLTAKDLSSLPEVHLVPP